MTHPHRPGAVQRVILAKLHVGATLQRLPQGAWRLDGRAVSRDACAGLYTYGYIMTFWDGGDRFILTELGKRAAR